MHLKKLKLNGFKSFASPVSLEFSSGITAIVGPNGSGKSNIADAIRWLLGEQSMKNIRSQNSKDLIFSGSKKKSKLGKANVSLCFDNQSGCIPLDFSEVIVSRNIFRDGTSEYFINKSPSRLMDVTEILAKANIGHRGFSVINQGMEAEILRYSPSELYDLLEEASGVRYLQLKKRRSERRFKSTNTNIDKISNILKELEPHLRFLKREATKAERKEKLKEKLSKLQKQFFFLRLTDLEKQKKELNKEKEDSETKIYKLKKEISKLNQELQQEESNIKEGREQSIKAQTELEKLFDERTNLSEKLANLRAQIQIENERQPSKEKQKANINIEQAEKDFKHIYSILKKTLKIKNINEAHREIEKILDKIEKIIGKTDLLEQIKETGTEQISKLINEQKNLEELLIEIDKKYQDKKIIIRRSQKQLGQERFFDLERKLRSKKDELSILESKTKEVNWITEQLEKNLEELKQDISKSNENYNHIKENTNIELTNESIEELQEQVNRFKYKIDEIGKVDEITLQEYQETKERYETLSKKLEDLKKAKQDLEGLIKQLVKEISSQFGQNFQVINDNFNKYLRLLFGGGKGYLKQTLKKEEGEKNDLETEEAEVEIKKGIEIKVILPGKRIKDIRMFSGGEKALTSIALLFSIISSNPPPFLVLDEVDATLDESNARRFAKLLNEFRKNTQFIVITHNRETINQADTLYGVTMGDDGVSTLLSLKLEK